MRCMRKHPTLKDCRVFFDFDNTITITDVLDRLIQRFSLSDKWKIIQQDWEEDRITTKACLKGQLADVRISRHELKEYLSKVKLDKDTENIFNLLKKNGIPPVILSDNFTPIIKEIFDQRGIKDVIIYANALRFYEERMIPSFPYDNPFCPSCAHCKKTHLTREEHKKKHIIYIGDGRSDFCPAGVSDIVFAKDKLLAHMKRTGKAHIAYKDLGEIYHYFKEKLNADV